MTDLKMEELELEDVANLVAPSPAHDNRQEGPHVTDLIRAAQSTVGKAPDYNGLVGLAAMGRIWESIGRQLKGASPVVLGLDGIFGNLDGVAVADSKLAVWECKLRFAEPADPRDNWYWMAQAKAYCKMLDTATAEFLVLYLPSRPPRALLRRYTLTFTQREIDENWDMLLKTKAALARREETQ